MELLKRNAGTESDLPREWRNHKSHSKEDMSTDPSRSDDKKWAKKNDWKCNLCITD